MIIAVAGRDSPPGRGNVINLREKILEIFENM
jgi:hypothetical protein